MNQQPVVVGVDGSEQSSRAAAIAWRIARAANVSCSLVCAIPDLWTPGIAGEIAIAPNLFDQLAAEVRRQLAADVGAEIPSAVRDGLVFRTGRPGPVLLAFAREKGADLIVVGARGRGVLARNLGGSTAHYLVRTADAPVLVAESVVSAPKRMLVAIDLVNAAPVLAAAARYAELLGLHMRALYVAEPTKFPTRFAVAADQGEFARRGRAEFERLLQAALPQLPSDDRVVRQGLADEEIVAEVADWKADFLVIGSHGRGWMDRMLIGSTTERLLNRLPASLIVVPINSPATTT